MKARLPAAAFLAHLARLSLGLLFLGGLLFSSCTTDSTGETRIDWNLSDSLKNYSNLVIILVDPNDTSKVLAVVHDGKLEDPKALENFKVPDSLDGKFKIVIRGYNDKGLLAFESRIDVVDGAPAAAVKTPQSQLPAFQVIPVDTTPSAFLSIIDISEGALSPEFRRDVFAYTALVPFRIDSIALHAALEDTGALLSLEGNPMSSGSVSFPFNLKVGENTFTMSVRPRSGEVRTYVLKVTRQAGNIASLAALKLTAGSLSPGFDPEVRSYKVAISPEVDTVIAIPEATDPLSRVLADGVALDSVAKGKVLSLAAGAKATVQFSVTSQDSSQTETYLVEFTRELSSDASLSGLLIAGAEITPDFNPDSTAYAAVTAEAQVAILPTARAKGSKITVNNVAVASGGLSQLINAPAASGAADVKVTIVVTAPDGIIARTYLLNLKRAIVVRAFDLTLQASAGGGVTLTPAFNVAKLSYTGTTVRGAENLIAQFRFVISSPFEIPSIQGDLKVTMNGAAMTTQNQFQSGNQLGLDMGGPLKLGLNTLRVQMGATVYTFRITREYSKNADLDLMIVNAGTLKPAFATAITSYSDTVANAADSIKVTATPKDTLSTMVVRLKRWIPLVLVPRKIAAGDTPIFVLPYTILATDTLRPGKPSKGLPLAVGHNLVEVQVIAEDSSVKKTYSVSVERRPSSNATLSGLSVHAGKTALTLSPGFSSRTLTYGTSTTAGFVTVTPAGAEAGQTITVNGKAVTTGTASGSLALANGTNTIKVEVLAPDKVGKATYTLNITKLLIFIPPKTLEP